MAVKSLSSAFIIPVIIVFVLLCIMKNLLTLDKPGYGPAICGLGIYGECAYDGVKSLDKALALDVMCNGKCLDDNVSFYSLHWFQIGLSNDEEVTVFGRALLEMTLNKTPAANASVKSKEDFIEVFIKKSLKYALSNIDEFPSLHSAMKHHNVKMAALWLQFLSGEATLDLESKAVKKFIGEPLNPFQIAAKEHYAKLCREIEEDASTRRTELMKKKELEFENATKRYDAALSNLNASVKKKLENAAKALAKITKRHISG